MPSRPLPYIQPCAPWADDQGYTLLSVLLAMALISATAFIGVTAYSHHKEAAQLNAAERQLAALMQQGRTHARLRGTPLVLSDSQHPEGFSDWQQGITLRTGTRSTPLLTRHWPTGVAVTGPAHRLFFMPRAFDSALTATFVLCTASGRGRRLVFNRVGSARHEDASEQDCQRR